MSGLMSGGDPICAMELLPIEGDIPIPIPAVVDMFELLLTPSSESISDGSMLMYIASNDNQNKGANQSFCNIAGDLITLKFI